MKSLITLTVFIFSLFNLQAQVMEVQASMSQGIKNGLTINLTKTNVKSVEEAWSKYLKEYKGKTKKNKKTNEVVSDDATVEAISSNTVDIYAEAVPNGEDVKMTVWIDMGGAYVNAASQPKAYEVTKSMLNEFSTSVSVAAVENVLEVQEGELKKMESEMKNLVKDKTSLEEEIAKCEKKIEEAKLKIETNVATQETKQKEIDTQMSKVKMTKEKLGKF